VNNDKNKLRDCLAVCALEAIIKSSESFSGNFEVNQRLKVRLHAIFLSYGNGATAIGVRSPVYTARKESALSRA